MHPLDFVGFCFQLKNKLDLEFDFNYLPNSNTVSLNGFQLVMYSSAQVVQL
jgi:hypothetical protein